MNIQGLKKQAPEDRAACCATEGKVDFSLYFFGNATSTSGDVYTLIRRAVKYADQNGFHAVWFPERHFDEFGGFSPNPSLLAAALAVETLQIRLRASVVLPLHHPVRVAEEWAMVDRLSNGRVAGLALAPGWHDRDFVLAPEAWENKIDHLESNMLLLERLWKQQKIGLIGAHGEEIQVKSFPSPLSGTLPFWFTALGNKTTVENAGRSGVGLLTNFLGQDVDDLEANIKLYRQARADAGLDPDAGHVTLLLHTFVGESPAQALETARAPLIDYLGSSVNLIQKLLKGNKSAKLLAGLNADDRRYLIENAADKFISGKSLIGSADTCQALIDRVRAIGVNEIGCFVDFGVEHEKIVSSLKHLSDLASRY